MAQTKLVKWVDATPTALGTYTVDPTIIDPGISLNIRLHGSLTVATFTIILPSGTYASGPIQDGQIIKVTSEILVTSLLFKSSNGLAVQRATGGLTSMGAAVLQYAVDTQQWYGFP